MGKFLVTGANGFLGSWLIQELSARGDQVVALVRNERGANHLLLPGVTLFTGDVTDADSLEMAMQGCEGVYHLAAFAKVWSKDPSIFYKVNVEGTENVLAAAKTCGVNRVVFCSSAGVLGPSTQGVITEKTRRDVPFYNDYEISKSQAEQLVIAYAKAGREAVIVSPTRIYGPYLQGEPESVSLLIKKYVQQGWRIIPGNGKPVANYVFVRDVVKGLILAMEKGRSGENYILGGYNLSYDGLFDLLKKVSGVSRGMIHLPLAIIAVITSLHKIGAFFGIPPTMTPEWLSKLRFNWEVDISKARKELGYEPVSNEEGIAQTVDFIRVGRRAKVHVTA